MDDQANATDRSPARRTDHAVHPSAYSASGPTSAPALRPLHARAASTPIGPWRGQSHSPVRPTERTPLTRSWSTADLENTGDNVEYTGSGPVAGGTIMGIHNLAIVFPQFIVGFRISVGYTN
jgi:solute carrier family 45 protein 1/2/4